MNDHHKHHGMSWSVIGQHVEFKIRKPQREQASGNCGTDLAMGDGHKWDPEKTSSGQRRTGYRREISTGNISFEDLKPLRLVGIAVWKSEFCPRYQAAAVLRRFLRASGEVFQRRCTQKYCSGALRIRASSADVNRCVSSLIPFAP